MTALSLTVVISLLIGSSAPQPGGDAPPPTVVMKVAPEWAGVLPKGVSRASGIPVLDQRLKAAGVAGVKRLHPNARVRPDLPRLDLVLEVHLQPGADPARVVAALRGRPELEYIEAVPAQMIDDVPNDPQYSSQWHLPKIRAPEAWDYQKGDSTIVIAIVDNGTDYLHPDLWDNVFTNEAEAAGVEGVDDDGNGFVDDVHGYDVAEDDADPSPCPPDPQDFYWRHGTHMAGNAAAMTDNGVGIAGVSWNCEYLAVKVHPDDSPQSFPISLGNAGIAYAAEMGADVISCSWGHFGSPSQYSQDAIDYATGLGALVVASAGNDPTGEAHYPSGYLNVVSVTWVNQSDRRDQDATWGRTVDISAPGVDIRSTAPDGSYQFADGSSPAASIAAGLAGLIKSGRPELGPRDLARQLVLTADNIDAQNPGFEGLLGTGRINALRAVTEEELEEYVYLETSSYVLTDSVPEGNGNGLFEQGETASLWITYRSYTVGTASNVTLTMNTSAPGLTVVNGTSYDGDVPGDTLVTCQQPLTLSMSADAPSQMAELLITYEATNAFWQQDTLLLNAGGAPLLLVDDDDGANNIEGYYLTVLDSLGLSRLVWTHATQGQPDSTVLLNFPVVIWACEWTFPSLEAADRAAIGSYLDRGGSLFMSGQDIGWSLCDPGSEYYTSDAAAWYQEYLHAQYIADDSEIQSVVGVRDDPIGDGFAFGVYQPGRDPDNQYPSVISPYGPDAHAVLRYGPDMDACVRHRDDHGVVYMAFGFEAVASGQSIDPVDHTGTRTDLMARILDYLGPIVHVPLRDTEETALPFSVSASMTSLAAPESLWLVWSTNPQTGYDEVLMDPQGGGLYAGEIPAPGGATDIWYYLDARTSSYSWPLPVRGTYRFHAGPDAAPPTMRELSQLSPSIWIEAPREITVVASDNLGLDVGSGLVHYAAGDVEGDFPLTLDAWVGEEAHLVGTLPSAGAYGDTVFYWCSVADTAASPNTGYSDTLWYLYGLDDFETGLDGWDTGTGWGLSSSGNPHSGDSLVTDSPVGPYGNNEDNPLTFIGGLDLHAEDSAALSFWALHALETDHDFCHIEASQDGVTWATLLSLTGRQMAWTNYQVSLNGFVGTGSDSVLLRFRLVSDGQGTDLGVFLDDVLIAAGVTPAYDPRTPATRPTILSVGPNPSRGEVALRVAGVGHGQIRLRIYDVSGRVVRTLTAGRGQTLVRWDGLDDAGTVLPSGMYHVRMEDQPVHRKVILIR